MESAETRNIYYIKVGLRFYLVVLHRYAKLGVDVIELLTVILATALFRT